MANRKPKEDDDLYDEIAEAADFIHDRLGVEGAIGFNNTVEEYMGEDEGKK